MLATCMTTPTALDSFIDKWRSRWPEWSVAEVFMAPDRRERSLAWFALLQEFEDILNVAGDPLPADAKLGWWASELRDWQGQRSRHPLGRLLEPLPAPWALLADALPSLVAARERPRDPAAQRGDAGNRSEPSPGRLSSPARRLASGQRFGGASAGGFREKIWME